MIGFGKATFSVTLPKTWVRKNKLKKGDTILYRKLQGIQLRSSQNLKMGKSKGS